MPGTPLTDRIKPATNNQSNKKTGHFSFSVSFARESHLDTAFAALQNIGGITSPSLNPEARANSLLVESYEEFSASQPHMRTEPSERQDNSPQLTRPKAPILTAASAPKLCISPFELYPFEPHPFAIPDKDDGEFPGQIKTAPQDVARPIETPRLSRTLTQRNTFFQPNKNIETVEGVNDTQRSVLRSPQSLEITAPAGRYSTTTPAQNSEPTTDSSSCCIIC